MYSGLELIETNPDPRSEAMSLAAQYREEGMSPSEALSVAWDDILGDDFGLDDDDEPYDFDEMLQMNKPKRRNNTMTMENPLEGAGIGTLMVLGSLGYLFLCAIAYKKNGVWSWTPWKTAPVSVSRRLAEHTVVKQPSNNTWEQPVTLIVP